MSDWISVEDRLPEPMELILLHNDDNALYMYVIGFMTRCERFKYFIGVCETGLEQRFGHAETHVTHWQPLPDPPDPA